MKLLNAHQLHALSRSNNRDNSWTPETVKRGLQIKFARWTTGYETLRKLGYPFLSNRTLACRLKGLKFFPGILHEVIDIMRRKAVAMQEADPAHVLKNLRGQLLSSSDLTLSDATVKENNLPSSQVKLEHVQAVLDYDAEHELKVERT
ncbi:hypothetical protein HPB49_003354 [Dermacentor silvarum]|uniref:Uncharacterized protein n=1 Tax=Dermacentor silvarum TaxID=543639 RepID=A0ACB8DTR7_DERSI|nr:hypothetical protein HPB49_003354 [Dermacentor silvarum]